MPGVFVTATGTEVGKTYVTAALIRAARRRRMDVCALKPVLTGYDCATAADSDAGILLDALGLPVSDDAVAAVSPWRFRAPLSPDMAAAREGLALDFEALVERCRAALHPESLTFIEGIGGVMVPLDRCHTVLDLIDALAVPVVLVTGSALGALSHCLTACEVLRARPPALIVLNESRESTVPLDATCETLAHFVGAPHVFPRDAGPEVHDALLDAVLALPGLCLRPETRHKASGAGVAQW